MPDRQPYDDTPAGIAKRCQDEMAAARKELQTFHERGEEAVKRYTGADCQGEERRANYWHADSETMRCNMYGRVPKVSVERRWADAGDDVARVAAEALERLLNSDVERDSDTTCRALKNALKDFLGPGLGVVRARLVREREKVEPVEAMMDPTTGTELAPAVEAHEKVVDERVEIDWIYWKDLLWSKSRVWDEIRWIAAKTPMAPAQLEKRFGKELADKIPLSSKVDERKSDLDQDPNPRADIWEYWDKENRKTYWLTEGYGEVLDSEKDMLELDRYLPFPEFLAANLTTSRYVPTSNLDIAKDQYNGLDDLYERRCLLRDALAVRGVYDSTSKGVKDLLSRGGGNKLLPVDKWAMFAEKGGLKGVVDWFPIDMVATTLERLDVQYEREKSVLQEVTGNADIMRGVTDPRETKGAQQIKARFGSTRLKDKQDEFARFASDVMRIKAEIISKHFAPETIIEQSNMLRTPDAQLAQQAVELIKTRFFDFRIEVKPEQLAVEDDATREDSAVRYMGALGQFFGSVTPMVQLLGPTVVPHLVEMAQPFMATMKGASMLEGVFDRLVAELEQSAEQAKQQQMMASQQPPPPDPKLIATQAKLQGDQMKAQADMTGRQFDLQADLTRIKAETGAEITKQAAQAHYDALGREHAAALQPPGGGLDVGP